MPDIAPRPYPLPPLPPNRFYLDGPDPALVGDGALVVVEDSDPFDRYTYRVSSILYQGRTAFQNVLIADTYNYGVALFLDGSTQSARDDEALYHELLVQPAMLRHSDPKDVLIIGGGEGATLREVLVHRSVNSVTMVDIDREVVELCDMAGLGYESAARQLGIQVGTVRSRLFRARATLRRSLTSY